MDVIDLIDTEAKSETPAQDITADPIQANDSAEEELPAAELLYEDLSELKNEFSELREISDITALPNPTRYAALRDLGLTPREAYLATSPAKRRDPLSHLGGSVPGIAKSPVSSMTRREWQTARALFEDMSDSDIEKLYRKVTK